MKLFPLVVLSLVIISGVESTKKPVNFRLDDIADWGMTNSIKAVINLFKSQNIPLSVGVVSNQLSTDLATFLRETLTTTGWDFEIVNHGYNHEYFTDYTLAQQTTLLSNAVAQTISLINSPKLTSITTFIPPYNEYNSNTIKALQANHFKAIASADWEDAGPYPMSIPAGSNALYHWPMAAATTDQNHADITIPVTAEFTFGQIQAQVNSMGFSSVMMHPDEFSNLDKNGDGTSVVNQTAINELQKLLNLVNNAGIYQFVSLGKIQLVSQGTYSPTGNIEVSSSSGSTTTTSTTAKLTTGKLTTSQPTTGRISAVTTKSVTTKSVSAVTTKSISAVTTKSVSAVTTKSVSAVTTKSLSKTTSTSTTTTGPSSTTTSTSTTSNTCSAESMRCVSSSVYQSCNHGVWGVDQSCQSGLVCQPSGTVIYCVRP